MELCSKKQPAQVVLCKDCSNRPPRDPEGVADVAPFDHRTHVTKNYSVDGKSVIGCAECHHTDQPASLLKPPYKSSYRNVLLDARTLEAPNAAPVFSCRGCHSPFGTKPPLLAALPPNADADPSDASTADLTSKIAYHLNCITCHQDANSFDGRTPASNAPATCTDCHKSR